MKSNNYLAMRHLICKSNDISAETMKLLSIEDRFIIIGRTKNALFAFDNSCPHMGASLSKSDLRNGKVICYMHSFSYDVFTGKLNGIPEKWMNQSNNWKKTGPLKIIPIFEKKGNVYVEF
jgi:nitrite reductase/ring-hydroxylating ferredoxin subunit